MKNLLLFLFISTLSSTSHSQISVRFSQLSLVGEVEEKFKSPYGVELGATTNKLDRRYQLFGSIGYFRSQSKFDEIEEVGFVTENGVTQSFKSTNKYSNLEVFPISLGLTLNILEKTFTPFVSLAIVTYLGQFDLVSTGGLITTDGNVVFQGLGLKPEAGLLYKFDDTFQVQIGIGKLSSLPIDDVKLEYWQIGLAGFYHF